MAAKAEVKTSKPPAMKASTKEDRKGGKPRKKDKTAEKPKAQPAPKADGKLKKFTTIEQFEAFKKSKLDDPNFKLPAAYALGIATVRDLTTILDVQFPWGINFGPDSAAGVAAVLDNFFGGTKAGTVKLYAKIGNSRILDRFACFEGDGKHHSNIEALKFFCSYKAPKAKEMVAGHCQVPVIVRIMDLDDPPVDAGDVYLRLHLLSQLRVEPNTINLDGIFSLLNTNCWTNAGVFSANRMREVRMHFLLAGLPNPQVSCCDKIPHLLNYHTPHSVRIGDATRVRLGAHLMPGTTVMQEGFVNYNAGTVAGDVNDDGEVLRCIIEGRISQGVVVHNDTDIGGGASTQGTLSGGGQGTEKITIGKRCLLGANSGLGISIGDATYVQAGHDVLPGHLVTLDIRQWFANEFVTGVLAAHGKPLPRRKCLIEVKAMYLSGISGALFYRDTTNGRSMVVPNTKVVQKLNDELHKHN